MVVKKRNVGDADQFAIIRAFTRMPRDASAGFPDAARVAWRFRSRGASPRAGSAVRWGSSRKCAWASMLVERGIDASPAAVADAGVKLKSLVSAGGDRQRERGEGGAKKGA
ncbi:hypothetical protein WI25_37910 [Burkholderia cepacia]|nr:hypothetical protein WI25_37910 [Burkholderia cepacia]KVS71184.1 hypothetical protein WK41_18365 [Burkholderia cepacia]